MTDVLGFGYVEEFLSSAEHGRLFEQLSALTFGPDVFRGQQLRRRYAQFGQAYRSTGRKLVAAPAIPGFLRALEERARWLANAPEAMYVTYYPYGAGIRWHTDAPCIGECIAAVSVGDAARLQLKCGNVTTVACDLQVKPGSLYLLRGPARWEFQHRIMPVKAQRYSITFANWHLSEPSRFISNRRMLHQARSAVT